MTTYCISPTSPINQCHNSHQVHNVLSDLVSCISYLLPAIEKDLATLTYDPLIEQKSLIANEYLLSSINNANTNNSDQDIKRLWFTYTRNRAQPLVLGNNINDLEVTSIEGESKIINELNERALHNDVAWLSFGNHPWTETRAYSIMHNNTPISIHNFYSLHSLKKSLPAFEPSIKHRATPYIDARGEYVSAMSLGKSEADKLLLISVEYDSDRWAYHETSQKFYRFKLTHNDRVIYHGFEVAVEDIPANLLETLKNL